MVQHIVNSLIKLAPRYGSDRCMHVADFLTDTLEKSGRSINRQQFVTALGDSFCNVISMTDSDYLIAAHYDTTANSQGAVDNASGVAAAILASLISGSSLALLACEEPPYFQTNSMGSRFLNESLGLSPTVIVIDSIGCTDTPFGHPIVDREGTDEAVFLTNKASYDKIKNISDKFTMPVHCSTGREDIMRISDCRNLLNHPVALLCDHKILATPFHSVYDNLNILNMDRVLRIANNLGQALR